MTAGCWCAGGRGESASVASHPVGGRLVGRMETIGRALLIHGDCLQGLASLPDNSVDMVCCDLPRGDGMTIADERRFFMGH